MNSNDALMIESQSVMSRVKHFVCAVVGSKIKLIHSESMANQSVIKKTSEEKDRSRERQTCTQNVWPRNGWIPCDHDEFRGTLHHSQGKRRREGKCVSVSKARAAADAHRKSSI